jgi:hypothetical protein
MAHSMAHRQNSIFFRKRKDSPKKKTSLWISMEKIRSLSLLVPDNRTSALVDCRYGTVDMYRYPAQALVPVEWNVEMSVSVEKVQATRSTYCTGSTAQVGFQCTEYELQSSVRYIRILH